MTTKTGYLQKKGTQDTLLPKTKSTLVQDVAKSQALSQTLVDTPDKDTLGYPAFSTVTPYAVGDIVYHTNKLWKFKTAHAAGAWNAAHVDPYSVKGSTDALETEIQTLDAKKADIDGSYPTLGAGIADNLSGRTLVEGTFLERTTGGDAEVANGLGQITEVQGNSFKFNQLVQNGNFADNSAPTGLSTGYITLTVQNNVGHGVVSSPNQYSGFEFSLSALRPVVGHKYIVFATLKDYGTAHFTHVVFGGVQTYITATTSFSTAKFIVQPVEEKLLRFYIDTSELSAGDDAFDVKNLKVFDLTQMFGAGNEPSTVEDFEAWLAANVGLQEYYDYDAGSVINNNMTGIESIGFNLLDPTTGKAEIIGAYSEVYGNYYGITGTHGTVTFTDRLGNTSTITPDADGKFEIDVAGTINVADRGADCAVFLWWDGNKVDYEPYEIHQAYLDVTHIYGKKNGAGELVRVWPTGMPKVNDIVDALKIENGAVVAKRAIQEVDLGYLTWQAVGGIDNTFKANKTNLGMKWSGYLICPKYTQGGSSMNDKEIYNGGYYGADHFAIKNTDYSDAATFKTAMDGILLYFELATPETYTDLVYMGSDHFVDGTPVTLPVNYIENNWGVERILPKNTSEVKTAPATLVCKYSIDAVEEMDTINTRTADINPDTVPIISKAFAYLKGEIDGLKQLLTNERTLLRVQTVDSVEYYQYGVPFALISTVAGAPSAANVPTNWDNSTMGIWTGVPRFVGQVYIDQATTGTKVYLATKVTNAISDWVVLN